MPEDFGIAPIAGSALQCGDSHAEGASILLEAISNPDSPRALACLPNAGAALVVAGKAATWREGADLAREAIDSGAAVTKLEALISATTN
jgi:anthranilate phosphoribosyltransferase